MTTQSKNPGTFPPPDISLQPYSLFSSERTSRIENEANTPGHENEAGRRIHTPRIENEAGTPDTQMKL